MNFACKLREQIDDGADVVADSIADAIGQNRQHFDNGTLCKQNYAIGQVTTQHRHAIEMPTGTAEKNI